MANIREYQKGVYRFALDKSKPRKKLSCPSCGRPKCFTPYVDVVTGKMVGPQFGICDHVNKCGYKRYPKGDDVGSREIIVDVNKVKEEYMTPYDDIANSIKPEVMMSTLNPLLSNNLMDYLSKVFGETRVRRAFELYKVGTMRLYDWGQCPVFWQIDKDFTVRTGKIMGYGEDGKRVREPMSRVCWYHTLEGSDFVLRQCLFGEHLLSYFPEHVTVNVVESEKTALICNIVSPDKLFMATGGLNNIRLATFSVLMGRKIRLHPDKGSAYDKWLSKANVELFDFNVEVDNFLQGLDSLEEGDDIGDYLLLREQTKTRNGKNGKKPKGLPDDQGEPA